MAVGLPPLQLCLLAGGVGHIELPVVTARLVAQDSGQCGTGVFPALVIY